MKGVGKFFNKLTEKFAKLSLSPFGGLYMPTLCAVAGIRSPKIMYLLTMCAVLSMVLICTFFYFFTQIAPIDCLAEKLKRFAPLVMFFVFSIICGAICAKYGQWRGCENCQLPKKKFYRSIKICILPSRVIPREDGSFYGYGNVVGSADTENLIIKNDRIFFNISTSVVSDIPVTGQKFVATGDLKLIGDHTKWWFARYLHSIRIGQKLNSGCLVELDGDVPFIRKFSKKVFDSFLYTLSIGSTGFETESGILLGMLTSNNQAMCGSLHAMFRQMGVAHLFAVSGVHMGIMAVVIGLFLRLLRVKRKYRTFQTLFLLMVYVAAIGCSPSALRALLMIFFYYIATIFGRRPNALAALTDSALVNILYDPFVAFNISFLLSYTVVSGILLVGVPLQNFLRKRFASLKGIKLTACSMSERFKVQLKIFFLSSLAISLAANVFEAPLSIECFGIFFLLTILVNVVVVPVATCAIMIGAVSLLLGLFRLDPICFVLNKIAFVIIKFFKILSQSLYFDSLCLKNLTMPVLTGYAWVGIMLCMGYLVYLGRQNCLLHLRVSTESF